MYIAGVATPEEKVTGLPNKIRPQSFGSGFMQIRIDMTSWIQIHIDLDPDLYWYGSPGSGFLLSLNARSGSESVPYLLWIIRFRNAGRQWWASLILNRWFYFYRTKFADVTYFVNITSFYSLSSQLVLTHENLAEHSFQSCYDTQNSPKNHRLKKVER